MLIEEYRGDVLENVHDGRICIVNEKGQVIGGIGDINSMTYYRSSSKPFQILPLIIRGITQKYNLTSDEITVCASSHTAEEMHMMALESVMKKASLCEEDLIMEPALPIDKEARERVLIKGLPKRKIYHNCSGKHLALMMLQRELTDSVEDYYKLNSPAQREVLFAIANVSDFPAAQIKCGIDGCGVPVFAVPLKGIATAYMKLANPLAVQDKIFSSAMKYVSDCIASNPYMMRGHGFLCGEINTLPNIVAKGGAEGVYGLGLKDEKIGIAFKINDGTDKISPLIIAEILRQLDYKDAQTFQLLNRLQKYTKMNDTCEVVGHYKPVFKIF